MLLDHVATAFALEYGHLPGGRVAVLALGKLGSREMTAASDLDLILIYDFDAEGAESDGPRRLGAAQYYARLTQRLLAALTAPTKAGRLYEVDLRLRPSGRKGPVATQFAGFVQYQRDEAETWEHMALTRARVIAGDAALAKEIESAIAATLCAARDRAALAKDVREMRALIAKEKGDADPWDLKLVSGGLLDIEFIAQFLVLAWAHDRPGIRDVSTRAVIAKAGAEGLLSPAQAEALDQCASSVHRCDADHAPCGRWAVRPGPGGGRRQTPHRRAPPHCPISMRWRARSPKRARKCARCFARRSARQSGGDAAANDLIGPLCYAQLRTDRTATGRTFA